MKMFSKFGVLFFVALAAASSASARTETVLSGDVTIEPKAMHPGPVKGHLKAVFADDALASLSLKLDKPIMGKVDFPAVEQWFGKVSTGQSTQLALAFRLFGPPHGWYFVFVGSSSEGIVFDGKIYKVRDSFESIKSTLKSGVPETADGKPKVPSNWRAIGTSSLKY